MADSTAPKPSSKKDEPARRTLLTGPSKRRNLMLYGALALSLALAGLLVWQLVRGSQLKREFQAERAKVTVVHNSELTIQAEQLLRTSGTLLGLAISASLIAEDFGTIENQIKPLVHEKQILLVAVADQNDQVRIATNHKLEGQALTEAFPGVGPSVPGVNIAHIEGGLIAVVSVEDGERHVGRAVIFYAQAP